MADSGDPSRLEGPQLGDDPAPLLPVVPDGLVVEWLGQVLRVSGEIDLSNHARLGATLQEATTMTRDDLYLDVIGLDFIDVAGVGLLVDAARRLAPRRLFLLGPGHSLRIILGTLADALPGSLVAMTQYAAQRSGTNA
jgi:anti-anti-sigma factor